MKVGDRVRVSKDSKRYFPWRFEGTIEGGGDDWFRVRFDSDCHTLWFHRADLEIADSTGVK